VEKRPSRREHSPFFPGKEIQVMLRTLVFLSMCAAATACLAHDPSGGLPSPRYRPKAFDPPWLAMVVQLHGHLGPWVVAGARLGMAGAKAVEAKGHFDVEVTCEGPFEKPPRSCYLDGVQLGAGATLGKRTIHPVDAKKVVLKVRNLRTGKSVEVRPSRKLMDILDPPEEQNGKSGSKPPSEEEVERMARDIATMADADLLSISAP
jgi:formylmethanofuran dehydrogenase subunit E